MGSTPPKSLLDSIRRTIEKRNLFSARTRVNYVSALRDADTVRMRNSGPPNITTRLTRLKIKVIEEIISSEETYLKTLTTLVQFRSLFYSHVDKKKLQGLLRDLDPIKKINENLLKELKNASVGKAFLNYAPYLKLYSSYASEFQTQEILIDKLLETNEELRSQVTIMELETKKKFKSLFIAPIQRIPRYKLLLQQLLGFMKSSEPDFNEIFQSLKKVEEVAFKMNEMVRSIENQKRLIELNKFLGINLIEPGRFLIKEGIIRKTTDTERYLILCTDQLMICKMKGDFGTKNSLDCYLILPLKKCLFIKRSNYIEVRCDAESFKFNQEEDWFEVMCESARSLRSKSATLHKPSSRRLPMKRKQIQEIKEETPNKLKRFLNISSNLNEICDYLSPKRIKLSNENGNGTAKDLRLEGPRQGSSKDSINGTIIENGTTKLMQLPTKPRFFSMPSSCTVS